MTTQTPHPIELKSYRPPAYLVDTVDLDVALDPERTRVRSRLAMRANPAAGDADRALRLDGEHLTLVEILIDGEALKPRQYKIDDSSLTIARPPAGPFTLEIVTEIAPEANKALSGLYRSRGIYCTQCEAEGFRRITYYLDRPDVLAVYTTRIEAPESEAPVLLSNGNPVKSGRIKGTGRHYAVWHDPHPKPSYLFALVGGRLGVVEDSFRTMSGREVELRIYVEPGKEDRCAWAMDSLKRSMRWDEKRFGREYDLDIFMIVAVSDFNMGAMENKGLNVFNDKLVLASADTATDGNYEAIESVIAHEYFHNWTGNRITCRDWFQLCLKEGLTVFRDQEFSADERSRTVQRIADVRTLRSHQFPEDQGPLAHPVRPESYIEINNFYTATVYEKGAELCRMLMTLVGREGFRKSLDLYFDRHDGEAATVEDFVKCFEDATGRDLAQFMLWYSQSGTPEIVCSLAYDQAARTAELTVTQVLPPTPGQPRKKPMHVPLRMGLIGSNGQELDLRLADGEEVADGLIELRRQKEVFRFTGVASRPVPSLLRGFSAPVNLTVELTEKDLEFLMVHDSDLYNRWQAGQMLASRIIIDIVTAIREGRRVRPGARLAKALGAALVDEGLEAAYRAQFLQLPSEADIAREIRKDVDPDAIHLARRQLRTLIARMLREDLLETYRRHLMKGAYKPDATSVGRRSLRNTALSLIAETGERSDIALVAEHFWSSRNMTDETASLSILADIDCDERQKALEHFERRWEGDLLVMDKWFAVQASSSLPGTLETVEELTRHPLFSLKNPNKVRALIGTFASANPIGFNRADGAGYRFVAGQVAEIDGFNPQVAARLSGAFRSWRLLEQGRRRHAKKALTALAKRPGISRDLYEIVSKTLEA
ncbi:MAG: aminopeptidase N [Hyphomicrobiaceae bacterium]